MSTKLLNFVKPVIKRAVIPGGCTNMASGYVYDLGYKPSGLSYAFQSHRYLSTSSSFNIRFKNLNEKKSPVNTQSELIVTATCPLRLEEQQRSLIPYSPLMKEAPGLESSTTKKNKKKSPAEFKEKLIMFWSSAEAVRMIFWSFYRGPINHYNK